MEKLNFKQLFDEIVYDWDYNYTLRKVKEGFVVNKLYIEPDAAYYKTDMYELEEGVFEKVQILYTLLKD